MLTDFLTYVNSMALSDTLYVRGAQGQHGEEITDAWISRREYGDATQIARVKKRWDKLKAKGATDIYAFDCSGFIMYYLQNLKGLYKDTTANGIRVNLCDEIELAQLAPGDIVFEMSDNSATHCGVYVGNFYVVECRGRDYGVVTTELTKRNWSKFGRLKCLANDVSRYCEISASILQLEDCIATLKKLRSEI